MLGWLWRRAVGVRESRTVFRYHDGTRWKYADPIEAWEKLRAAVGDDPRAVVRRLIAGADPDARRADAEKLAGGVCVALGVKPLADDGSGLTRRERVDLAATLTIHVVRMAEADAEARRKPAPARARVAAHTKPVRLDRVRRPDGRSQRRW